MPHADLVTQQRAQHESYLRNKAQVVQRSRDKRKADRQWLDDQKQHPCADCLGRFPPCVMDFHHRDSATKIAGVAELLLKAGRQRVVDEIAKCDLVCANCHRIRTYMTG